MEKAYSYRFYPTPEQESLLRRTLGCVRLVYNKALHERTQAWYEKQERVGYAQTSSMLTDWKKQEELELDKSDEEMLKNLIKESETLTILTKAQALECF